MDNQIWLWIIFNAFVVAMLVLDQIIFHKKAHAVTMKEAAGWSIFWVSLALLFNLGIYFWRGQKPALEFFTGYLIELSLSVDNLFVFLVIFSYFRVPGAYQHKVLLWGIIGAQVMRAIFIFAGVSLISMFHWLIYLFGAFLIFTGIKMFSHKDEEIHPEQNPVFKLFKKFLPVTNAYENDKFFIKQGVRYIATPLFMVLVFIDIIDLIFALDSVPAVLAITLDPFIVYTSNIFAILGLRAFYFVLAGMMKLFHYLHYGLSVILVFVGVKMIIGDIFAIPIGIALSVVILTLLASIAASLIFPRSPSDKQ